MAWSKTQAKIFARNAKKGVGNGWAFMVRTVRQAIIAQECLMIVLSQARETVAVEDVRELYRDMLHEAGIDPDQAGGS